MEYKIDMIKFNQLIIGALVCAPLSACLEVKDKDLTQAIEAQNTRAEKNETPTTLYGSIIDKSTGEKITHATISLKVGPEWRPDVDISGDFLIEDLPTNTDFLLKVKSSNAEFLTTAYIGKTGYKNQFIGELPVSAGITKHYAILDFENSDPIKGLSLSYNTSLDLNARTIYTGWENARLNSQYFEAESTNYEVTATFDENTGLYSIVVPKESDFSLSIPLDLDDDGHIDFKPSEFNLNETDEELILSSEDAHKLEVLYLNKLEKPKEIAAQLKITIKNRKGETLEGVTLVAVDKYTGRETLNFDGTTKEYLFDYQSSNTVKLNMASYTDKDGMTYSPRSFQINSNANATTPSILLSSRSSTSNESSSEIVDGIANIEITIW